MVDREVESIRKRLAINSRAMIVMVGVFLALLLTMMTYTMLSVRHNVAQVNKTSQANAIVLKFLKDIQDPNSQISHQNSAKTEDLVTRLIKEIRNNREVEDKILARLGG